MTKLWRSNWNFAKMTKFGNSFIIFFFLFSFNNLLEIWYIIVTYNKMQVSQVAFELQKYESSKKSCDGKYQEIRWSQSPSPREAFISATSDDAAGHLHGGDGRQGQAAAADLQARFRRLKINGSFYWEIY